MFTRGDARNGTRIRGPGRGGRGRGRGDHSRDHRPPHTGTVQRANTAEVRRRELGFRKLQEVEGQSPSEVVFFLKSSNSGFRELLAENNITPDKLALVWSVISVACRCEQKENLTELLKLINEANSFSVNGLQNLLLRVQYGRCQERDARTLEHVTTFLETIQVLDPTTILSTLSLTLPILKDTVKSKLSVVGQGLLDRLERVEEKRVALRDRYNIQFESSSNAKAPDDPSDSYRDIPIFPDAGDILSHTRPFLRPNIVHGAYRDVEHYLDVQFRLLREDFVRPLREGIAVYQEHKKKENHARLHEIKVYTDVVVRGNKVTDDGVLHEIQFPLVGPLQRVNWEHSKRLIFGSLLCFTGDNFQSFSFATVSFRDAKLLQEGRLYVRFEKKDLLEVDKDYSKRYVIIETDAYFEAYRHVLTVLQEITVDTFPLKECIVYLEKQVKAQKYVECQDSVFCFPDALEKSNDKLLARTLENSDSDLDVSAGSDI